jgi:acyl-CoA reductase-like NAD-dependent aldehyde dehydrogenase
MRNYELYIGGEWVKPAAAEYFESYNPFNQEPWAQVAQGQEADVQAAVDAARQAFETTWRHTAGVERARLMHRLATLLEESADDMGVLESTDNGKVIRETRSQMLFSARLYRFYAGYADKI